MPYNPSRLFTTLCKPWPHHRLGTAVPGSFSRVFQRPNGDFSIINAHGFIYTITASQLNEILSFAADLNGTKHDEAKKNLLVEPIGYREVVNALNADEELERGLPTINGDGSVNYTEWNHGCYSLKVDKAIKMESGIETQDLFDSKKGY
ncbi:hypothetical protein NLJ89_g10597 [Agrocybe chaxingu]|uniref:Uncharacterized protein n=1 Tax=Agrocybe chaxingu TaxID=84603 RepID=A0A9W8JQY9_9AGAR|nr:hypothetical protein NLJ89_g10597 [Agrocybe chaxingu]